MGRRWLSLAGPPRGQALTLASVHAVMTDAFQNGGVPVAAADPTQPQLAMQPAWREAWIEEESLRDGLEKMAHSAAVMKTQLGAPVRTQRPRPNWLMQPAAYTDVSESSYRSGSRAYRRLARTSHTGRAAIELGRWVSVKPAEALGAGRAGRSSDAV